MNCLTYARVSTERQAERELSIPAQTAAMRRYAQGRDWIILNEFVEAGASARTADRPQLHQLLHRCRSDERPKIDVVVVHKIDRLARNLADHLAIRALLLERRIVLASVTESLEDSGSGRLIEHMLAAINEFYSSNLSEEVKKGMRQKVLQGGWPHNPPLGYRLVPSPSGLGRMIEVDPIVGPAIQRTFEMAHRGFSHWERLRHAAALEGVRTRSGKPLAISSLSRLRRNPFYAGLLRWRGQIYPGRHRPLVDKTQFDDVQQILRTRSPRMASRRRHFLLRGIAKCSDCGGMVTGEKHGRFEYYRCLRRSDSANACKAKYCNADRAHAAIERIYRDLVLPIAVKRELS